MNKELRNTLAWIVCATGIMSAAIWQAQVSIARGMKAQHQTMPPPLKSRKAIRLEPEPWAGDPVEDYIARCQKGLTDQEIGWIIEDFKNAGLDVAITEELSLAELFALRTAQHRWYHDALAKGLRLSPEQSAEVAGKLNERFDLAKANFVEASGRPQFKEVNGIWINTNDGMADDFANVSNWLMLSADPFVTGRTSTYQPCDLCTLTPGQEGLTTKHYNTLVSEEIFGDPPSRQNMGKSALELSSSLIAFTSIPDISFWANLIFPTIKEQEINYQPASSNGTANDSFNYPLAYARILHPAQLKLALLFDSTLAERIQENLNAPAQ